LRSRGPRGPLGDFLQLYWQRFIHGKRRYHHAHLDNPQGADTNGSIAEGGGYLYTGIASNGSLVPVLTWTKDTGDPTLPPAPPLVSALLTITINCSAAYSGATAASDNYSGDTFPHSDPSHCGGTYFHLVQINNTALATSVILSPVNVIFSAGNGTGQGAPYNDAALTLTTAITSMTLNLTGTVLDASKTDHILIGQQAGAYLDPGTTGNSITNIQWTAMGNTLQGWTGVQNGTTAAPYGSANPYTFTQSSLSQSKPPWYWSDVQSTKIVSCTATVTPPAGQGAAFTLNAARNVFLDVPTWSESESSNPTRVDSQFPPLTGPALWAGTTTQYQNGSQWSDGVTITPIIYPTTGDWAHLQIITIHGTHSVGSTATPVPNDGMTGLDGGFPYRVDGSYYKDNGNIVKDDGDSPGINLLDTYDTYSLNYSFDLYVMYYPPGANSIPVPLTKLTWTWKSTVTRPASGHWAIGAATIAPSSNPTVPIMGTRCIDEPTWTTKINPH
jgi:hypothetical protein